MYTGKFLRLVFNCECVKRWVVGSSSSLHFFRIKSCNAYFYTQPNSFCINLHGSSNKNVFSYYKVNEAICRVAYHVVCRCVRTFQLSLLSLERDMGVAVGVMQYCNHRMQLLYFNFKSIIFISVKSRCSNSVYFTGL